MATRELTEQPTQVAVARVDTDVHVAPQSGTQLLEYVPEPWRSRASDQRLRGSNSVFNSGIINRGDGNPPSGLPPAADPDFLKQQLLDELKVDYAILVPTLNHPRAHEEHEAAFASAINSWQADTWLSRYNAEERYYGSIVVGRDSRLATLEIERWAEHPGFIQILANPFQRDVPLGHPNYHPMLEAAARHKLPVALHKQVTVGTGTMTPVGFPSYYLDSKPFYAFEYTANLVSLVCEGVFEKFPDLKVVLIEGGYLWLVPLMWRLDNHWRELRAEVPLLKRPPSEYIRDRVRLTTQPFERPTERTATTKHFLDLLDWLDAGRMLMFSSDYPHWDGDYKPDALFARLPKDMQQRIYCENALDLYDLPRVRTLYDLGSSASA